MSVDEKGENVESELREIQHDNPAFEASDNKDDFYQKQSGEENGGLSSSPYPYPVVSPN